MRLLLILLVLALAALAYLSFTTPPYRPAPVEQPVPRERLGL